MLIGPSARSRFRVWWPGSISLPAVLLLCFLSAPRACAQEVTFRISPSVPDAVGAEIQKLFAQSLEFLSADLGVTLSHPVTVFVYGSQREIYDGLASDLGYSEAAAREVAANASLFVIGRRLILNAAEPVFVDPPRLGDRARVISHELAHVIHNDLMGDGARAPQWFKEGFAVRMELRTADHLGFRSAARDAQEYLNLTLFGFRRNELVPLTDLGLFSRWQEHLQREGAERVYAQSFVAIEYLTRTRGQQAVLAYFRAFQSSRDASANFDGAFGLTVEAFDQEFGGYLASQSR